MSVIIKAHFDGKTIVPDEPVNLPINKPLEAELRFVEPEQKTKDIARRRAALRRFSSRAVRGVNIPAEALRRENLYEDRA